MKPLSLFYVITGILGIGTITTQDVQSNIQINDQIVIEENVNKMNTFYLTEE